MMTIEGVLHQRGSEMDLYSPRFFEDRDQLIEKINEGHVLLYGQEKIGNNPTVVTLEADLLKSHLDQLDFIFKNRVIILDTANKEYALVDKTLNPKPKMYQEYFVKEGDSYVSIGMEVTVYPAVPCYTRVPWYTDPSWRIASPQIPPEEGWITTDRKTNMWGLRSRYLAERDSTAPIYCSIGNDAENFIIRPKQDDDFVLAQRTFRHTVTDMMFFVNGLCCLPIMGVDEVYGQSVKLRDGVKYLRNQTDRNRGIVGVDFGKQCNVEFYTTAFPAQGELPKLIVDKAVNPLTSSFLLVLDGRLYLPDEFVVTPDHVLKIEAKLDRHEYTLDRMCCENNFQSKVGEFANSRTIIAEPVDLKESRNSFLIVFKRRGLKVIRHKCLNPPNGNSNLCPRLSQGGYQSLLFNASAKGLLFDEATRSIVDYVREENDMTHYDDQGIEARRWSTVTALIQPDTRLEIWAKRNNDMSASATMHDRSDVRGSAFVLEPKYTMIEFLFDEG